MKGVKTKGICQTPHSPPGRKQADTTNHLQIPFRKKEGWLGAEPTLSRQSQEPQEIILGPQKLLKTLPTFACLDFKAALGQWLLCRLVPVLSRCG